MKKSAALFLGLLVSLTTGASVNHVRSTGRIVGGSSTTIDQYPYGVAMLYNQQSSTVYSQWCGGTILTSRAVLTAAHCVTNYWSGAAHNANWWRIRVGSSYANSGGIVYGISSVAPHSSYDRYDNDNDVAVLGTSANIGFGTGVQPASIAGRNYILADDQPVWAIGWGALWSGGPALENLQHVQIWTVNQAVCKQRYSSYIITDSMLCSGWLDVGGRDQCQGDSGGPLIHNNVIVGVCSWGAGCANAYYPGVNARVSALSDWIISTAEQL